MMIFIMMLLDGVSGGEEPPPADPNIEESVSLQQQIEMLRMAGFWTKIGIMALAAAVVSTTLCLVVCAVGQGCYLNKLLRKPILI